MSRARSNSPDDSRPVSPQHAAPTYPIPKLPAELCDMIIENLCGDKDSLANCSVVSRSWYRTARHHLFESILICRQPDRDAFKNFVSFVTATPDICPSIRVMCIDGYNTSESSLGDLDAPFMEKITAQVPFLQALMLINCGWKPTKPPRVHASVHTQVPIKELYINNFQASRGSVSSKLELLRHFSRIECLYLSRLWLGHFNVDGEADDSAEDENDDGDDDGIATMVPPPPINVKVKHLILSMADICLNFLEHLRRQPFMEGLSSLRIRDLWDASYLENHEDLLLMGDIIRDQLSNTLTEFHIDLPRHGPLDGPQAFTSLQLESCRRLKSITINMFMHAPDKSNAEAPVAQLADGELAENEVHDDMGIDAPIAQTGIAQNGHNDDASAQFGGNTPSPGFYTANEWRTPLIILSQLPPTISDITIGVELVGSDDDIREHLKSAPAWEEYEKHFLQLPALRAVYVRMLMTASDMVVSVEWDKVNRTNIASQMPLLAEKKLLNFERL